MTLSPEQQARQKIDDQLVATGRTLQDYKQLNLDAARGIVLREIPLKTGPCDYHLLIDHILTGVIESPKADIILSASPNNPLATLTLPSDFLANLIPAPRPSKPPNVVAESRRAITWTSSTTRPAPSAGNTSTKTSFTPPRTSTAPSSSPPRFGTVLTAFKDSLPELFPGRALVPKTLIFAKDDNHAEDIVRLVHEVFGKGNDFAKKITYKTYNPETKRYEKSETLIQGSSTLRAYSLNIWHN